MIFDFSLKGEFWADNNRQAPGVAVAVLGRPQYLVRPKEGSSRTMTIRNV